MFFEPFFVPEFYVVTEACVEDPCLSISVAPAEPIVIIFTISLAQINGAIIETNQYMDFFP